MSTVPRSRPLKIRALVDDPDLVSSSRKRLVESATRLFLGQGFHNTSTRDIAREAGVSVGAIYQYIRHKEDLLLLILQAMAELHEARLYPVFDDVASGGERLWSAIDVYYRTLDEQRDRTQVLYHEFPALRRELRGPFRDSQERIFVGFREMIRQGIDEGRFAPFDAHFLAHNIVSMGLMWVLRRARFHDRMTLDGYIEAQVASVRALLVPPARALRSVSPGARRTGS